jgi:hypothetical protein
MRQLSFEGTEEGEQQQYRVLNLFRYVSDNAYVARVGQLRDHALPDWRPELPSVGSVFDIELQQVGERKRRKAVFPLHPCLSVLVFRGLMLPGAIIDAIGWRWVAGGVRVLHEVRVVQSAPFADEKCALPRHALPLLGQRGFYVDFYHTGIPLSSADDMPAPSRPPCTSTARCFTGLLQRKSFIKHDASSSHFDVSLAGRELMVRDVRMWPHYWPTHTVAAFVEKDTSQVLVIRPVTYSEKGAPVYNGKECVLDSLHEWADSSPNEVRNISGTVAAVSPRHVSTSANDAYRFVVLQQDDAMVLCTVQAPQDMQIDVGGVLRLTDMTVRVYDRPGVVVCEHTPFTFALPSPPERRHPDAPHILHTHLDPYVAATAHHYCTVAQAVSIVQRLLLFQWRTFTISNVRLRYDEESVSYVASCGNDELKDIEADAMDLDNPNATYCCTFAVHRSKPDETRVRMCSCDEEGVDDSFVHHK